MALQSVPLQALVTQLLISATCLGCGLHISITAPKVYTAGAFSLMYAAGLAESLGGSIVYILEDRNYKLGPAASVPNMLFYFCIMISSFASLLLASALLEYVERHWLGRVARKHRIALSLCGAALTAGMLVIIGVFPSFQLAMFLSIPSGAAFVAALVLVWRQSWANGSPLAWLHRPVLWALAGMIVSLLGTSESAVTTSFCGSGARIRLVQCPYVSAVFYPQTVYNVLRLVGYVLMWVGARGMCHGHALHGVAAGDNPRARAQSYGTAGVVQRAPATSMNGGASGGASGEGRPLLSDHSDPTGSSGGSSAGSATSEVRVPVRPFSATRAPLTREALQSDTEGGVGATPALPAGAGRRPRGYTTPSPGSRRRRHPHAAGGGAGVGASRGGRDDRLPAALWLAEGEVQDGGVVYTPVPAGVLSTTFPFS